MKKLFYLLVTFIIFSCSKSENDNSQTNSSSSPETLTYIRGTLGSETLNFYMTKSSNTLFAYNYSLGYQGDIYNRTYFYGGYLSPMPYDDMTKPILRIDFKNMITTTDPSAQANLFYPAFEPVPTNFLTDDQDRNLIKGIEVAYHQNGLTNIDTTFSTLYTSQANSTISYTSVTNGTDSETGKKTKIIIGNVKCKLANYNATITKDFIGEFKLILSY
ncbi:MAG: hypothetical protein QM535_10975 [Limnohabitans sp.]|nr:hypothetical protein [Limnohabitans sp.]